jgi:DNA polymerase III subunit beta
MPDLLTPTRTLTVNRQEMLEGLSAVSGAVPSRSPKEILKNVLLEASGGRATLLATDLEIGIRYRLLGVDAGDAGDGDVRIVLPTERFRSILADAENDEVVRIDLSAEPGARPDSMILRGARWKHRLPLENPDLFPAVPDFGDEIADYLAIQAADIRRAIRRTVFATDAETSRYALAGCLFEIDGDDLTVVATDGRRLSRQHVAVETEGLGFVRPELERSTVVPAKTLRLVLRVTDDEDFPVHLAHAPAPDLGILIRTERAAIHSRLVEGRYPDYRTMIPSGHPTRATVVVGALLEGVKQAGHSTSIESRSVDFTFSGDTLILKAEAADVGRGDAQVAITCEGPEAEVSLDPRYLTDVLKALDPELTVCIGVKDHKVALMISSDDRFEHAVMPITRE